MRPRLVSPLRTRQLPAQSCRGQSQGLRSFSPRQQEGQTQPRCVRWLPFPGGPPELLLALSPRLGTQRKAAAYRGSMGFQLPGLGPPVTGPAAPRPPRPEAGALRTPSHPTRVPGRLGASAGSTELQTTPSSIPPSSDLGQAPTPPSVTCCGHTCGQSASRACLWPEIMSTKEPEV